MGDQSPVAGKWVSLVAGPSDKGSRNFALRAGHVVGGNVSVFGMSTYGGVPRVLREGVWIAADGGGWWPMTEQQRRAWDRYVARDRKRHNGMGNTVWMAERELQYSVDGYIIMVRHCGSTECIRTSDGMIREVLEIPKPLPVERWEPKEAVRSME